MRCRQASGLIGPYIDGELELTKSEKLQEHLESCGECSRQLELMRGLIHEVSSLPAVTPSPEESYRIMNRVRREMAAPLAPKPRYRRIQIAAATLSVLVIATVAGVTLAVWGGGEPAPEVRVLDGAGEGPETANRPAGEAVATGLDESEFSALSAPIAASQPSLVVSQEDYSPGELQNFRNDIGTRLDFYSSYWYPASVGAAGVDELQQVQEQLVDDLAQQAAAAGEDPEELKQAVGAALEQAGDEPLLPCYAELATMDGVDTWLVSLSGPEDYLLFSNPQRPPAMILASLGGEESLKISESLLRELARRLAPYYDGSTGLTSVGDAPAASEDQITPMQADVAHAEADREFQSFLRQIAAQGSSLDVIAALEELNYDQILMLLQGDWAALAADGVNLSDFLKPPKRLWAVDCSSNQILWEAH